MKTRCEELIGIGDALFTDRIALNSLWQQWALQFYPERADFTSQRQPSNEFASHLMTGQPAMARRDMANTLSAMLRPRGQPWFHARTNNDRVNNDPDCMKWLDWATEIQRKFLYEPEAKFQRATKEGDNDFVTFGQTVLQRRVRRTRDGLIYVCHHLRDCAWLENEELAVDVFHRKGKMQPAGMLELFGDKCSPEVKKALEKDPSKKFEVRHIVMPSAQYDLSEGNGSRPGKRLKFVSVMIDVDNETILEEVGQKGLGYIIPRWQTVSGSQYAHSPSSVIALSDARMLQQINLTLIEAGQKSVDPPWLAKAEMIAGGVNTGAGMVTWIDAEYDEKLGEALRPLMVDRGGFSWADGLQNRILETIKAAFYLDQIKMPDIGGPQMTAYEVQKRYEEYVMRALPLFEPLETEYNAAITTDSFETLLDNGAFGDMRQMPPLLRGQSIKYTFESPLQQAQSRANSQAFLESANLLKIAASLDPSTIHIFDARKATRDALVGAQAPADWLNSEDMVAQMAAADQQRAAAAAQVQAAGAVADTVNKAGQAGSSATTALQQMMGTVAPQPGGGAQSPVQSMPA